VVGRLSVRSCWGIGFKPYKLDNEVRSDVLSQNAKQWICACCWRTLVPFAFTIGSCFQTSDVAITSRSIRRMALVHAIQSFAYNTTVIALMLNVMFSLMSG
jgi:predicted Co/Zn/Cd cation transporter (cation efflux family)